MAVAVSKSAIALALISRLTSQERIAFASSILLCISDRAASQQLAQHSDAIRDHALALSAGASVREVI